MTLIKSRERVKALGEVFTPPELIREMLDRLPPSAWERDKRWLEPSCGNGNFLVEIVKERRRRGWETHKLIDNLYAIDIMPDNIAEAHARLLDTLLQMGLDTDMIGAVKEILRRQIVVGDALKDITQFS